MSFTAIPIQQFLERRKAEITEAKELAKTNPNMIVVDLDDEIICDVCNALIEVGSGLVWVNEYGVYCPTCRRKNA